MHASDERPCDMLCCGNAMLAKASRGSWPHACSAEVRASVVRFHARDGVVCCVPACECGAQVSGAAPLCNVCGHNHVQGVKCDICGHVGNADAAAAGAKNAVAEREAAELSSFLCKHDLMDLSPCLDRLGYEAGVLLEFVSSDQHAFARLQYVMERVGTPIHRIAKLRQALLTNRLSKALLAKQSQQTRRQRTATAANTAVANVAAQAEDLGWNVHAAYIDTYDEEDEQKADLLICFSKWNQQRSASTVADHSDLAVRNAEHEREQAAQRVAMDLLQRQVDVMLQQLTTASVARSEKMLR